mmetsp:Transcript_2966/g.5138  ORF Transcript_2966/g.5138 Transcript_2966/m.5138 type:complete len:92 (+) Transcript_2966:978-1253(+)
MLHAMFLVFGQRIIEFEHDRSQPLHRWRHGDAKSVCSRSLLVPAFEPEWLAQVEDALCIGLSLSMVRRKKIQTCLKFAVKAITTARAHMPA